MQEREEALEKRLLEVQEKEERVNQLEGQMVNLEWEKEQMKKKIMLDVKREMMEEKRKLLELRNQKN